MAEDNSSTGGAAAKTPPFVTTSFRTKVTKNINIATAICAYTRAMIASLQFDSFLSKEERNQAQGKISPFKKSVHTLEKAIADWTTAIETLEEPDRRKTEKQAQLDFIKLKLSNYCDTREPEEEDSERLPLEILLDDCEHFLEQLEIHHCNIPSNENSLGESRHTSVDGDTEQHHQRPVTRSQTVAKTDPVQLPAPTLPTVPKPLPNSSWSPEQARQVSFVTENLHPSDKETRQMETEEESRGNTGSFQHHVQHRDRDRFATRGTSQVDSSLASPMDASVDKPPTFHLPMMPQVQLPAMPLPTFTGKEPWAFTTFLRTFESLILSQPGLPEQTKLFYLRSCLRGDALDTVSSILDREGCYLTAVNRLRDVYKAGSQQIATLLRQRINQVKRGADDGGPAEELKSIRELLSLTTQLLSLDGETDHPLLTEYVMVKLPEKSLKKAAKLRQKNEQLDTITLLEELETAMINDLTIEKITKAARKGMGPKKESVRAAIEIDDPDGETEGGEAIQRVLSIGSSHSFSNPSNQKPNGERCAFCQKHPRGQEEHCKAFSTAEERQARCRQLRLCFKCIATGADHNFRRCDATCAHCGGRHHRSLCMKLVAGKSSKSEGIQVCKMADDEEAKESDDLDDYYDELQRETVRENPEKALAWREIIGSAVSKNIPRLPRLPSAKLFTCKAILIHPTTGRDHQINLMVDPGASVPLISERIVRILGMQCIGEAETAFSGVGGHESEFRPYRIHGFTIRTSVQDSALLELQAYEYPTPLTGPERQYAFSAKDRNFIRRERLETAVLEDADGPPDVMISLLRATELMNTGQKFITLPSGMRLFPTSIGYMRVGVEDQNTKDSAAICFTPQHINTNHEVERWSTAAMSRYNLRSKKKDLIYPIQTLQDYKIYSTPPTLPSTEESELSTPKPLRLNGMLSLNSLTLLCCLFTLCLPLGAASEIVQSISCLPHGIAVNATPNYGIQVCSTVDCHTILPEDNHGSATVLFPPSISVGPFEVVIKLVSENATFVSKRVCPASDVCKNMMEDWSWDHLMVPHCFPATTMALIALLSWGTATILLLICYMMCFKKVTGAELLHNLWRCHCFGIRGFLRIGTALLFVPVGCLRWWRRAQGDRRRREERREAVGRRARVLLGLSTLAILFSLIPTVTSSCHHAVLTTEEIERCQNGENCRTEEGLEITIDSLSRTGCIKIGREGEERIEGSISIEVTNNSLVCARRSFGLHRDAEIHTASSKRCFSMGSCDGHLCENMNKDTALEEFDHLAHLPGHSFCMESCGGWECGCASFHSGCLFYRNYLVPTTSKIYESLKCTSWSNRVTLRINTTIRGVSSSTALTLREGEFSHGLEKEGVSLIRVDEIEKTESTDLLREVFVTDGSRMAATRDFRANNFCPDEQSARDFKCKAQETCVCQAATIKAKCDCDDTTIEQKFTLEETLPIRLPSMDITIDPENRAPLVHLRRGNVKIYVALAEEFKGSKIREEEPECEIRALPAQGCYQCPQGARIKFECTSQQETEALLACGGNVLSIPCDSRTVKSARWLHFESSEVKVQCQTSCSRKEIALSGTLFTPPHLSPTNVLKRIKGGEVPRGEILPDLGPLIDFLFDYWKTSIAVAIVTVFALVVTMICLISGPAGLCWILPFCRRSRKRRGHEKIV